VDGVDVKEMCVQCVQVSFVYPRGTRIPSSIHSFLASLSSLVHSSGNWPPAHQRPGEREGLCPGSHGRYSRCLNAFAPKTMAAPLSFANSSSPSPAAVVTSSIDLADVINAMFSTFSIIALGYLMGCYRIVPASVGQGMGTFLFQVALPCLIFHSVGTMSFDGVNWWILLTLFTGKSLVFLLVLCLGTWGSNLANGAVWAIFCTQSNDFALGLPLLKALYKSTHPTYSAYIYLVAPISLCFLNPVGFVCMEMGKQRLEGEGKEITGIDTINSSSPERRASCLVAKDALIGTFSNPLVLAVLLGLLFNLVFHGTMTPLIADPIKLLGSAFDGVALFCLGLSVVGKLGLAQGRDAVLPMAMVGVKCCLLPILCKVIIDVLPDGISETATSGASDLVFLLGMFPTAPGVFLYARRYGMPEPEQYLSFATAAGTFLSAPIILVSAIFIYIVKDTVKGDTPWDNLQLEIKMYVGLVSLGSASFIVLPLLFSRCIQPVWKQLQSMSMYDKSIVQLVFLMCLGHIALPIAVSTCSLHSQDVNRFQWIFIFGGTVLYRLAAIGMASVMLLYASDISWESKRWLRWTPLLVILFTLFFCALVPILSREVTGHSPADRCEHPYEVVQLWIGICVNFVNAVMCSLASKQGFVQRSDRGAVPDRLEEESGGATLILRSTLTRSSFASFRFHETIDHKQFLTTQASFFVFQTLSAWIAFGLCVVSIYALDQQGGLVRLIVILDGVILYGSGAVTAWCWSMLGFGRLWGALANYVRPLSQNSTSSFYSSFRSDDGHSQ
jgi:predicted permease